MQRDRVLVAEMIVAVERIVDLVGDRAAGQILADPLRRDALMWNFTVLGEAASQVSGELKSEHGGIEWSDPIRLRNRIVHGYWSIDVEILVSTATHDLPGLLAALRSVDRSFGEV